MKVLLVPLVVAWNGVEWWLGSSTERALTWKSLCVPSGDKGTHRCGLLLFRQTASYLCLQSVVMRANIATDFCSLFDRQ